LIEVSSQDQRRLYGFWEEKKDSKLQFLPDFLLKKKKKRNTPKKKKKKRKKRKKTKKVSL